ncbi:hypothetical protein GO495_31095 [Chitinophaga oryziterrae]|uniref:Protein SirB1 N-terminal domain-containing protein n=1 Tax=Chitinophaga oryziterrae TaxID=1031224 RepID=A0A6N8JIL5_9BACT|nr:hypothetical protein [Chitinophaga oryziterrae]MVT45075.1 hypothetical protein [Chitinophaga oryziterrae]
MITIKVIPLNPINSFNKCFFSCLFRSGGIALLILANFPRLVYAQSPTPKFQTVQTIPFKTQALQKNSPSLINYIPLSSNNQIEQQNVHLMQNVTSTLPGPIFNNKEGQLNALRQELKQNANEIKENRYTITQLNFKNYFDQLLQLNPDSFSITKAVYLSEAAFYEKPYSFQEFEASIKLGAELVGQILKRENLSNKNNIALNYGIQKLYTSKNLFVNKQSGNSYLIDKLHYDFDDYLGEKDWKKMFVTKMLQTGSGQCHSMPLFYLCLAEQLNAKAYLALAPNHSYIQFFDSNGSQYNFETTNGHLVSTAWLMQSTYVNATAFKNKTYLDTLSSRKLYAQCLTDFVMNYSEKINGYDSFTNIMLQRVLDIDSNNVTALMIQANYYRHKVIYMAQLVGNPPLKELPKYPDLYATYKRQRQIDNYVKRTGYQEIPKEAYEKWLKSLELVKHEEQAKPGEEKVYQEIEKIKK